jgi:hypothetical protein
MTLSDNPGYPRLYAAGVHLRSFSILLKLLVPSVVLAGVLAGQSTSPVEIKALRQTVFQGTTRVVIEFSGEFEYHSNRLHVPERIYFDFPKAKLQTGLPPSYSKEFVEEAISGVRVAEPVAGMTRVVLDLLEQADISTAKLTNPARLLIELRPTSGPASKLRTNVPLSGDDAPTLAQGQGATPPLKPINLEVASRAESASVQVQPGLSHRRSLTLSPISATPGSVAAVQLALDSSAGQEPLALQWELSYPSPKLGLEDGDLVTGSAASSTGKSLSCAGRVESASEYVYRCILAGGLKPIPNGPVALINFRVRPNAKPGPATVRIRNAVAVSIDGKEAPIQPNEADVTIR